MTPSSILYIEDEEDYQILVKRILGRAGLDVKAVETGREGLGALQRERPSLLILDINLPDADGYTICRQLRQDPAWVDLPILLLTVRRRPEEWLRGFSSGANDYLSKPLNPPELLERVVNCLERKARGFTGNGTAEYHLIQAAVAGNRAAFEVLIQKYRPRLEENMRQAVQNDTLVEDIVSQVFSQAFQNLDQFRGDASFYTWVYRIALNESMAVYRNKPGMVSFEELTSGDEDALPPALAQSETPEDTVSEEASGARALEALSQVPEPYRQMLEMFFLKDMPYETIAKTLRIPLGTVMSRLFKARKLLQEAWRAAPPVGGTIN